MCFDKHVSPRVSHSLFSLLLSKKRPILAAMDLRLRVGATVYAKLSSELMIERLRYRLMLMIAQCGGPQISKKSTNETFPRFGREIEHPLSESRVASDE